MKKIWIRVRQHLNFEIPYPVVLEKTLESQSDYKEIKPILKEVNSEYSLEGLILKLKLQYLGHLI